jgi:hypothetical protein
MTTPGIKLLKRPSIILFCGRPASGKTTVMVSVICQIVEFKKNSFGRFYVSTKFSGDFNFAPDDDIFEDYTQEHLEAYVNKIKAWKKRNPTKNIPQNLLVIDDAMGQINWYSRFWSSLISTHRHWDMNILVATQSLTAGGHGSSTLLRNCVDMAVLYHSSFINTKNIYTWLLVAGLHHSKSLMPYLLNPQKQMETTGQWHTWPMDLILNPPILYGKLQ